MSPPVSPPVSEHRGAGCRDSGTSAVEPGARADNEYASDTHTDAETETEEADCEEEELTPGTHFLDPVSHKNDTTATRCDEWRQDTREQKVLREDRHFDIDSHNSDTGDEWRQDSKDTIREEEKDNTREEELRSERHLLEIISHKNDTGDERREDTGEEEVKSEDRHFPDSELVSHKNDTGDELIEDTGEEEATSDRHCIEPVSHNIDTSDDLPHDIEVKEVTSSTHFRDSELGSHTNDASDEWRQVYNDNDTIGEDKDNEQDTDHENNQSNISEHTLAQSEDMSSYKVTETFKEEKMEEKNVECNHINDQIMTEVSPIKIDDRGTYIVFSRFCMKNNHLRCIKIRNG